MHNLIERFGFDDLLLQLVPGFIFIKLPDRWLHNAFERSDINIWCSNSDCYDIQEVESFRKYSHKKIENSCCNDNSQVAVDKPPSPFQIDRAGIRKQLVY